MSRPFYHILAQKPKLDLKLEPGPSAPNPTGGYGGWVTVARPASIPFTQWEGGDVRKQDISVMLDGYSNGKSIENELEKIKKLGRPPKKNDDTPPPTFRVFGPIHESGTVFVLEALEFGLVYRENDGTIVRQELTLKLMEYVDPDEVRVRAKHKRTSGNQGTGPIGPGTAVTAESGIYDANAGDTIKKIAVKIYGDVSVAKNLGDLNSVRDINKVLKTGQKIKLPEWL